MTPQAKKQLTYNGVNIPYLLVDGLFYLPLAPVCAGLGVDYHQAHQLVVADKRLSHLACHLRTSNGGELYCLPERYLYGWLFCLPVDATGCFDAIFEFFHGGLSQRLVLLEKRAALRQQLIDQEALLYAQSPLTDKCSLYRRELKQLDEWLLANDDRIARSRLRQ